MPSDNSNYALCTFANGVTVHVDDSIRLEAFPSLNDLFKLGEMSDDEFGQALKTVELSDLVIIRPDPELKSSSLMDASVLEDEKMALGARSGSGTPNSPKDPFYPLVNELQDVVYYDPSSVLYLDRGVRHEINMVPGTKYCATRHWPLPMEQCDVIEDFFRAKHATGMTRESNSSYFTPKSCVRKPNDKWRIVHAYNKLNAATITAQTPTPRKDVL